MVPVMPPLPLFDPIRFLTEIGYTLIMVLMCLLVFLKTKEVYELTKHRGIYYFRSTFLFFGLAYLFRLLFDFIQVFGPVFDLYVHRSVIGPLSMLFTGYFSTIALLCLIYSTVWKKFSGKEFIITANLIALVIAFAAVVSPVVFIITQVFLLVIAIVLSCFLRKKSRFPKIFVLYFLLFLFWALSIILVLPKRVLPFELRVIMEIISVALFAVLYYRVAKWTK